MLSNPAQNEMVFRPLYVFAEHNFESAFVQESKTAPKLALGPVVFGGARAINWQRVSSNPLPTGERLCTAIAVD
jgi:hypothetical protein